MSKVKDDIDNLLNCIDMVDREDIVKSLEEARNEIERLDNLFNSPELHGVTNILIEED